MSNPDDFYELWKQNGLKYGQHSLFVHHEPYLIDLETVDFFKHALNLLQRCVEKITTRFIQGHYRELFSFDPRMMKLILADPGYSISCPISRWDSFFYSASDSEEGGHKNLKFIELNTDGTSGMAYIEELEKLYLHVFRSDYPLEPSGVDKPASDLTSESLDCCHFKEKILKTLLACYASFPGKKGGKPQIAIVDWQEVATRPEQEYLCRYFNDQGFLTVLADPRSLKYDGQRLRHKEFEIDLIYRRVVTGEYMSRLHEVEAMTQSYLDRNVCLVGSFRSQIGFDKRIFEILSSEEYDGHFTAEENEIRKKHIPWTRILRERTVEYGGQKLKFPEDLIRNRGQFIIKPPDLNRGQGVIIGSEVDSKIWEERVRTGMKEGHIIQEKLQIPRWKDTDFGFHLGHFMFNSQLAGWMCRLAKQTILNDQSDERLMPCFMIGKT